MRNRPRQTAFSGNGFNDAESFYRQESEFCHQRYEEDCERFIPRPYDRSYHDFSDNFRPKAPAMLQMIDRTVEEFGEDFEDDFPAFLRPYSTINVQLQVQYSCTVAAQSSQDHTSQYTTNDPISYAVSTTQAQYPTPPPAHEDQGFMPPPPALPLPEFSQGCHKGSHVEFNDPHEEKTFTVLLSEDDSKTSTLITSEPMSPSREVLDLSLPKQEDDSSTPKEMELEDIINKEPSGEKEKSITESEVKKEIVMDKEQEDVKKGEKWDQGKSPSEAVATEESPVKEELKIESVATKEELSENFDDVEEDCTISIEPSSMPSMPEAIIAIQSQLEQYLCGLTEEEWIEFEQSSMPEDDDIIKRNDHTRLDCNYCGMIFSSIHVRKFHEESHKEAKDEEKYDDGEETRLFCGFCGRRFKNLKYRKLHEMTHTVNDVHLLDENTFNDYPFSCRVCGRQFRFESDLLAHKKLFCSEESVEIQRPSTRIHQPSPQIYQPQQAQPQQFFSQLLPHFQQPLQHFHNQPHFHQPLPSMTKVRPRLVEQDGWIEDDPHLPKGWRMKTRPRPSQEGQVFSVFLSPDNKVFHSRKGVIEHMKLMGCYCQADYERVKEGSKPGPRKQQKRKSKFLFDEMMDKKRKTEYNLSFAKSDVENCVDSATNNIVNESEKETFANISDFEVDSDSEPEGTKF